MRINVRRKTFYKSVKKSADCAQTRLAAYSTLFAIETRIQWVETKQHKFKMCKFVSVVLNLVPSVNTRAPSAA